LHYDEPLHQLQPKNKYNFETINESLKKINKDNLLINNKRKYEEQLTNNSLKKIKKDTSTNTDLFIPFVETNNNSSKYDCIIKPACGDVLVFGFCNNKDCTLWHPSSKELWKSAVAVCQYEINPNNKNKKNDNY
jgi:hypothetical protein